MSTAAPSFLGLEDHHVFITGGAGGVGSAAAKEFLGMLGMGQTEVLRSSNMCAQQMDAM